MPDNPHPRTGRIRPTQGHSRYVYNPDCACVICANGGQVPQNHPEAGHSFCYGLEHIPPSTLRRAA
jgi:hypothetical protein